jgi:hypothetical protein
MNRATSWRRRASTLAARRCRVRQRANAQTVHPHRHDTKDPLTRVNALEMATDVQRDGIGRAAKELDVDLIAIGSHGYPSIDRLLGTVAAKVVNHADRNVLVVRTAL